VQTAVFLEMRKTETQMPMVMMKNKEIEGVNEQRTVVHNKLIMIGEITVKKKRNKAFSERRNC
jgi:hypothetical protein